MKWINSLLWLVAASAAAQSTEGLYNLVKRRLPNHVDDFRFDLKNYTASKNGYDQFEVRTASNGTVLVEGNTVSALSSGLHRYLTDVAHVDIYWFIGSRLHRAPSQLPRLDRPLEGSSTVPWRYHLNTVTFSYTMAFWTWEDWELELDWMALRGVNLPLAWVGQEKILIDVFQEIGLTNAEIATFLSGPAFQAWNRFGNIQGSWNGDLPRAWVDDQFNLQKKIIHRMVELGMTPVLPSFTGFVPANITRIYPNASVIRGAEWGAFPPRHTNDTFLQPFDEHFPKLQKAFISKQREAYGDVSHIYTLDQYNEMDPSTGDLDYLRNVSHSTWRSLKEADPDAVWMMQGWLFWASSDFWTKARIEAYLSGVERDSDMLILDLWSESMPQWRRTDSYFGKPWIWCQLHDYGGNMGLYGQIMNLTVNATEARRESPSMVGFGLTMEGQEGNEIVYDLLLDQAWSSTALDTKQYFHRWVESRYAGSGSIPKQLYQAWEVMREPVYSNTNLAFPALPKSVLELKPAISGLLGLTFGHGTNITYDPAVVVEAWQYMYQAASSEPDLWSDPAYQYDMVDVTRQVMANAFVPMYTDLVKSYNDSSSESELARQGDDMLQLLNDLDAVLLTNRNFRLSTWISAARGWAHGNASYAAYLEYQARNQVTLWGPNGEITDYASKQWAGLVSSYYMPRWKMFFEYIKSTPVSSYNTTALSVKLRKFELAWQEKTLVLPNLTADAVDLQKVLGRVQRQWPSVFEKFE